jgi:hydrogenase expression/formation protein HypD
VDILQGIYLLVEQVEKRESSLENGYQRAVTADGNIKAQQIMQDVFQKADATWRGLGTIPESGLKIREEFAVFDAEEMFELRVPEAEEPEGCACGEILRGAKIPTECPLYGKVCTPIDPVGPCMVSSEGSCAAYYRYQVEA